MGRQHNKEKKKLAGVFVPNYRSKTKPSYSKYQDERTMPVGLGRPLYRYHRKRNELKHELSRSLGLPPDTKFIFRRRFADDVELEDEDFIEIHHGTVVVIDKDDLSLVLVVRCSSFSSMPSELRQDFDNVISTTFQHAQARNKCTVNGASKENEDDDEHHVCGWMGCCGWRGGSDPGRTAGTYAVSAFTASSVDRLLTDKERMERFHFIRDFLARRFESLSLSAFKANVASALEANVPSFDDVEWQNTASGKVFASNLVVTCDGFSNRPHTDKDRTRYAWGLWSMINRQSGMPIEAKDAAELGSVKGACFVVKRFGIKVALSICDGTYEMIWDVNVPHYTSASKAYNAGGMVIEHQDCAVSLYGSCCQVVKSLANRIRILEDERKKMSPPKWEAFKSERVKSYNDEYYFKMKRHQASSS